MRGLRVLVTAPGWLAEHVLRVAGGEGVNPNTHAMLFSRCEAPLRQVKRSSWHESTRIRGEMLFTPSPGQQWELAATRTAA